MRLPRALRFVAISAFLCAVHEEGAACQCGALPSVERALLFADHVFVGTVTAIEEVQLVVNEGTSQATIRVSRTTLRVGRRWQGNRARTITVYGLSNCAYPFERGRSYLVFAGP